MPTLPVSWLISISLRLEPHCRRKVPFFVNTFTLLSASRMNTVFDESIAISFGCFSRFPPQLLRNVPLLEKTCTKLHLQEDCPPQEHRRFHLSLCQLL